MFSRRKVIASLFAVACAGPVAADSPMFYTTSGVALAGYDPVTFFGQGSPRLGNAKHRVMWKGAIWHFATAQNRELFEANPRAYAPQFGGYCAYAVSRGHTASPDPEAWKVHEGRLYFVHDRNVQALWQSDLAGNIAKATDNWPAVLFD